MATTATAAAAAAAAAVSQMGPYTSLWSSVAEWFTPTVFFVLLNVVIGTIAVTSKSLSHHSHGAKPAADHHQQQQQQLYGTGAGADFQHVQYHDAAPPPPTRQLSRTGSMLQRLKSFNLSFHMYRAGYHRPEENYGFVAAPAVDVPEGHMHLGVEAGSVPKEPPPPQQQKKKKPAKKNPKPQALRDPSPPRRELSSEDHRHQQHHLPQEEEVLATVAASDAAEFETLEEAFLAASGGSSSNTHLNRIQSDTHPTAGERPRKLAATMKKSASTKSAFAHFEAQDLPRRPATTRDTQPRRHNLLDPAAEGDDDDDSSNEEYGDADDQPRPNAEVDERADDFINRFRQQLKLQRLESLMRYRDMLNRGR